MKISAIILGAAAQLASAHYFFDKVIVDGAETPGFQYIREFTRPTYYNPIKFSSNPPEDIRDDSHIDGEDIICNQGAFSNAGNTEVLTVNAGDDITVKLGVGALLQHPGPSMAYLSRAPSDDVKAYDGSGDWFKIFEEGVCNPGADFTTDAWCSWDKDTMTATIPADTPDGEYLFRAEHIGVHRSHVNQPEHYVSCVQIKVVNGGTGNPGPMTQFPGAYSDTDEYANFSIYNGYKDFPFPGPEVWSGGGNGGNGGDSGDSSDGGDGGNSTPPADFNEIPQPSRSEGRPESDDTPEFGDAPQFGDAPESGEVPEFDDTEPCTRNQRRARRSRRSRRTANAY